MSLLLLSEQAAKQKVEFSAIEDALRIVSIQICRLTSIGITMLKIATVLSLTWEPVPDEEDIVCGRWG